jgi:polyphosphate kinase 2 (PPK2 family)
LVLFDRSWYNRAGVEAVMNFCTPAQVKAFLKQAPVFEKLLVDDGIRLFKYWLTVDQDKQEERFAERLDDPLKRWKLSPVDLEARMHYADYGRARDRMLKATHTREAPWTLVDFNDQHEGRLTLIRDLLSRLPRDDTQEPAIQIPPLPGKPLKEKFRGPLKPI